VDHPLFGKKESIPAMNWPNLTAVRMRRQDIPCGCGGDADAQLGISLADII
jgi:hypothetical protein